MPISQFTIAREYAWDADRHFSAIIRFDELGDAMQGQASYVGLPNGEAVEGQVVEVKIKLFGWLPIGRWRMEVVERNDTARRLRSLERGGAVKSWHHTIEVEPLDGGGCVHRDSLEIDAGWLTGLYTLMAKRMYHTRHDRRQIMRQDRE